MTGHHQPGLARTLRDLRATTGMSLEEMEIRHGIHRSRLGAYERGDRAITVDTANQVLDVYRHRLAVVRADHRDVEPDYAGLLRRLAAKMDRENWPPHDL